MQEGLPFILDGKDTVALQWCSVQSEQRDPLEAVSHDVKGTPSVLEYQKAAPEIKRFQ